MAASEENWVKGPKARLQLGIGATRYSAILRAMGCSGRRWVKVSQIRAWLDAHPDFRETDVYVRLKVKAEPGRLSVLVQSSAAVQSDKSSLRK